MLTEFFFQCSENEFTCNNGTCIELTKRCDDIFDCNNESDEQHCGTLSINKLSYWKVLPPVSKLHKTEIDVSAVVLSISNINELEMTFKAELRIDLRWKDERIIYKHLKLDDNFLGLSSKNQIWLPVVYFSNTEGNTPISSGNVMVIRQGSPIKSPISELDESNTYSGAENDLQLTSVQEPTFKCQFELTNFPFDTQYCSITMTINPEYRNYTEFVPNELNYLGRYKVIFSNMHKINANSIFLQMFR